MRTPNWLYRLLRCRNALIVKEGGADYLGMPIRVTHRWQCERHLHFGAEHR
jgi:hypothetical protein